uniref:Uncharacterized protein n=1 Tax=Rhizophora mucronata TaxID=61149 RepID=A0A2P2MUK1_RHIMU
MEIIFRYACPFSIPWMN